MEAVMDFKNAIQLIYNVLDGVGSVINVDNYDGLIVKRLEASNTLDSGRTTNQTHIAITGEQMDMFPYVRADGYFEIEYEKEDNQLKKFFVAQIPVYLHKENIAYLDNETQIITENEKMVHVSIVRSRRKNAADQIQMSMTNMDSPEYVQYRRIVHSGSYMVMLKRYEQLIYDLYTIKASDITFESESLKGINNRFFKLPTNTAVKLDEIIVDKDKGSEETTELAREYIEADLSQRKIIFTDWLSKQVKPIGKPYGGKSYSPQVVKSYTDSLELDTAKLDDVEIENSNLFYYTDLVRFSQVVSLIKKASNFDEINKKRINKGFSCAMDRYSEFLAQMRSTDIDDGEISENEESGDNKLKNCLEIVREPRTSMVHPLNFIIYGAPGTGKTYSTAEYALAIIENRVADIRKKTAAERKAVMAKYNDYVKKGQIVFTTFHQSYGYEEFIQGLRPDTENAGMSFKTIDGTFKKIADTALIDPDNNYVIIIDEINRANISKVFGELITLIEEDKRWGEINETCATLQSGDIFAVPNNLYIVGTMNSADKSISLIDAALRRRFSFIEQQPDDSLVEDSVLRKVLHEMNLILAKELDSTDLLVGHSYFMNKTADNICDILNNSIIPLLYEYFYDNRKKVANILNDVIKKSGASIELEDQVIGRLRVKTKDGADDSEQV